jgi:hypothetical protein
MKKGMQEPCIEGVATHDDPESCVGARKDAGEALTGARAGRAIEPRNEVSPGRPRRWNGGRQHRLWRYRESQPGPARSENHGMYGIFMRENREVPGSPARLITGRDAQGRPRPQS